MAWGSPVNFGERMRAYHQGLAYDFPGIRNGKENKFTDP